MPRCSRALPRASPVRTSDPTTSPRGTAGNTTASGVPALLLTLPRSPASLAAASSTGLCMVPLPRSLMSARAPVVRVRRRIVCRRDARVAVFNWRGPLLLPMLLVLPSWLPSLLPPPLLLLLPLLSLLLRRCCCPACHSAPRSPRLVDASPLRHCSPWVLQPSSPGVGGIASVKCLPAPSPSSPSPPPSPSSSTATTLSH